MLNTLNRKNMPEEIKNKESLFGTETNADGSPVQEVTNEAGETTHEIRNKESLFGTEENADGSPVQKVRRLKFEVQHLLVASEALIGCFVFMSFSGSVVEVIGDGVALGLR